MRSAVLPPMPSQPARDGKIFPELQVIIRNAALPVGSRLYRTFNFLDPTTGAALKIM